MSTPDPFAPPTPMDTSMFGGSPMSSAMTAWGQSPQASMPQAAGPEMTPFQQQYLDLMGQQGQAPSKWATGANTFGTVAQGLASLANIWMGWQGLQQQKKAFAFNKGVINTNLNNSILDYNRRLGDTLANRALNNGKGDSWVSQQLAQYSARRH